MYIPSAYTPAHLIERTHAQDKRSGLYPIAVVEWEGFTAIIKTWPEWKSQLIKVCELREASGISVAQAGYHKAANVHEDEENLAQVQLTKKCGNAKLSKQHLGRVRGNKGVARRTHG